MLVNQQKCIGCRKCVPYCPANAISIVDKKAKINQDACYECGICEMVKVCKPDALYYPKLEGLRLDRYYHNNVLAKHPVSKMTGRGTAEMKTNELTNRYKRGEAGFGVEIGRPDIGATFRDVQTVSMAVAEAGGVFAEDAPTTLLMEDCSTGRFKEDTLDERVICSILEFSVPTSQLAVMLKALEKASQKIDTVFSVDLITRSEADGSLPNIEIAKSLGYTVRPNGKTTLGLGRPGNQIKEGGC